MYLRQVATMGAKLLHVLEMHHRNAIEIIKTREEKERAIIRDRENAERLERQRTPSPWGDAVCAGCGSKRSVWADDAKGVCARCQTPLVTAADVALQQPANAAG